MNDLEKLKRRLSDFAAARDWDQFHSPKNLSMALIAEAGELLEHFQWLTESQSARLPVEKLAAVRHELADVLIYLIRLADKLDVNLLDAVEEKMAVNEARYPADKVRGRADKYTDYERR